MNNLCVILMLICAAAGDSSERKEQVTAEVDHTPRGHSFSIPIPFAQSHSPAADYSRLTYVPRYEPNPHYGRLLAPHAFPFAVSAPHANSHAVPHPAAHVIHHAAPYTTGPFSGSHFAAYHLPHNYSPFAGPSAPAALSAADPAIVSSVISAPNKDAVKQASVAHISGAFPFHFVPSFAYAYSIPVTKE